MEIGKPKRIITIHPLEEPIRRTQPQTTPTSPAPAAPQPAPDREKVPA